MPQASETLSEPAGREQNTQTYAALEGRYQNYHHPVFGSRVQLLVETLLNIRGRQSVIFNESIVAVPSRALTKKRTDPDRWPLMLK